MSVASLLSSGCCTTGAPGRGVYTSDQCVDRSAQVDDWRLSTRCEKRYGGRASYYKGIGGAVVFAVVDGCRELRLYEYGN